MSIHTGYSDTFHIVRLETDMVMDSDENAIKHIIEQALQKGTRNFIFSVSIGALANRIIISHLLHWCKETIGRQKGKLIFIEKNDGGKCVFASLCESLHIPMYQNIETALVESSDKQKNRGQSIAPRPLSPTLPP
jgi:hypothetical protein